MKFMNILKNLIVLVLEVEYKDLWESLIEVFTKEMLMLIKI